MQKEYLVNVSNEITLNVTDGKVDSYRVKDETQSTVRVYDNDKIGVAGALGDADWTALEKQAKEKLNDGIPYPCKLNKGVKKSVIRDKAVVAEQDLIRTTKRLAKKVANACPRFLINGKTQAIRRKGSYKNSQDTDLAYENNSFTVFFQVKDKDSSNIADAYYQTNVSTYGKITENKIVNDMKTLHDAFFGEKVTLPDGKYPVIVAPYDVLGNVVKDFIAEYYISGGSLFSGKLGEKIFNENLSVCIDRNPKTNRAAAFYDSEGEIAKDYRAPIIENGTFKNVLNNKNTSTMFNLPLSKTSAAPYDGVPSIGVPGLYLKRTAPDLKTMLGAEKAVYIAITSGGDMTTEGVVGMPVQLAFLVENGKITARLTDFSASGNIKEMLGEDFVGVSAKDVFDAVDSEVLVTKMNVING
ncbi:MAG: hypothetical protein IJX75_02960 [Clostridia bacterium]|nr:hypothetical protein [Clostridia bacterium]